MTNLRVSRTRPIERVADYVGITSRSVRNVLKKHGTCDSDSVKDDETASQHPTLRQSKLDSFDKTVVKKAALSLISNCS